MHFNSCQSVSNAADPRRSRAGNRTWDDRKVGIVVVALRGHGFDAARLEDPPSLDRTGQRAVGRRGEADLEIGRETRGRCGVTAHLPSLSRTLVTPGNGFHHGPGITRLP